MASLLARTVSLKPHPDTRNDAVRGITARVSRMAGGLLAVAYILDGNLRQLVVPPPRRPGMAERLWEHTCFELFIARQSDSAYHELNFSPSGEWAAYAFARYRDPVALDMDGDTLDPKSAVQVRDGKLELNALIRLDRLSPAHVNAPLSLALAAVLEHKTGSLSYWALEQAPGKPDFHQRDAFLLALDEVRD